MVRSAWFGIHPRLLLLLSLLPFILPAVLIIVQPADAVTPTPVPPKPTLAGTRSITSTASITATGAITPTTPAAFDKRAAAGQQVYLKNYCGICHSLATAGTTGRFGPPHNGIATIAKQRIADPAYTGEAVTVVQYLRESLVEPRAYITPGYEHTSHPMPPYGQLPKADLDALVYFLLQQK